VSDVTVDKIMRRPVPVVSAEDSVGTVARTLIDSQLPGVPVLRNSELVGIVTEADFVTREAEIDFPTIIPFLDAIVELDAGRQFDDEIRKVLAMTAEDLMTHPVYNIRQNATISELATLMIDEGVNPVPVIDDNLHIVGIVCRADLVRFVADLESAATTLEESADAVTD
jgi:CBS domain-containing protein